MRNSALSIVLFFVRPTSLLACVPPALVYAMAYRAPWQLWIGFLFWSEAFVGMYVSSQREAHDAYTSWGRYVKAALAGLYTAGLMVAGPYFAEAVRPISEILFVLAAVLTIAAPVVGSFAFLVTLEWLIGKPKYVPTLAVKN